MLGELELALSRAGELTRKGRHCGDAVVLSSLLGCKQQPFHFLPVSKLTEGQKGRTVEHEHRTA